MSRVITELMAQQAAQARLLRHIATLEGGFDALANGQFDDWADTVWPTPGAIRILPAVNAQGMRLWRHATGTELVRWVGAGCPEWRRQQPVFALGSLYRGAEIPTVLPGYNGPIRLLTTPVIAKKGTPNARLQALLREHPDSLALVVVPRD